MATTTPTIEKQLPPGWRWARLEEHVTKIGSGITPRGGHSSYVQSGVPLIRSQNVHKNRFALDGLAFITTEQDEEMSGTRVEPNDVLLNITGASIGRVCVVPNEVCPANVNQHVSIIRTDASLDPEFLALFISSPDFQNFITGSQSGATRQALTKAMIEEFLIPFPPLPEQKRIASILNERLQTIEKAGAAAESQLESAKALSTAYLWAVFNSFDARKWRKMRLTEVAEKISDGTHLPPSFSSSGVPFLFVRNIVTGRLDFDVSKYVSQETYEALTAKFRPRRGDVLFSAVGSFGVAVVVDTDRPFTFQRHIAHIRPRPDVMNSFFLTYYLNSPEGKQQSNATALGGAQRTVTLKSLAGFEIPVPPLRDQEHIAAAMTEQRLETEALGETLQSQLDTITKLPAAFLRQAFNGEL